LPEKGGGRRRGEFWKIVKKNCRRMERVRNISPLRRTPYKLLVRGEVDGKDTGGEWQTLGKKEIGSAWIQNFGKNSKRKKPRAQIIGKRE